MTGLLLTELGQRSAASGEVMSCADGVTETGEQEWHR